MGRVDREISNRRQSLRLLLIHGHKIHRPFVSRHANDRVMGRALMNVSRESAPTKNGSSRIVDIAREIRTGLKPDERMSFVSGNFNVLHPGHLRLLKFAAEISDKLVVGVNPDDAPGVTMPSALRREGVASIAMVHHAVLLETPPEVFIAELRPDFVVKGKEFEGKVNSEQAAACAYGGQLVFSSSEMRFSSAELLQREFTTPNYSAIRKPLDFPARHGFTLDDIRGNLSRFGGIRALVVGDLIIDDYVTCEPLGMSQEDPTIVVSPIDTKTFVGGAGVVSAHARGLGADVCFCSVVGDDESAGEARSNLEAQGIALDFFVDSTRPTTRKRRYRAHNKTLLRVNHLRQHAASPEIVRKMLSTIERRL